MKDFLYCSVFEYLKIDQHSIITPMMQKLSFVFIKAFSIKIKYFIAFTLKNLKKRALQGQENLSRRNYPLPPTPFDACYAGY